MLRSRRLIGTSAALVAAGAWAIPNLSTTELGNIRPAAAVVGHVGPFAFADDSTHRVRCDFNNAGSIASISVPAPEVKPQSGWTSTSFNYQYVRWRVAVEAHVGSVWTTVAKAKPLEKVGFHGWTRFRPISPFTRGDLGGAGNAAYRVIETLIWYGSTGHPDGQASQTIHHYHYGYNTSSRSDCQNRPPVAFGRSASTYPGEGNSIGVSGHDPDGDSPLTTRLLGSTMNGSPISGFAELGSSHDIQLFPTTNEVGNVVDIQYELVDPAGAKSYPATISVTVNAAPDATPSPTPTSTGSVTPSPTPTPTATVTVTPTPTTTVTVTPTPTPTVTRSSGPAQIAAPTASDHNAGGTGYNGAIQVTFTDPAPGSGTLTEIDYALNGTSTAGSWVPAGAGQGETKTISGLTNGATYTVALRACNSASICGAWSTPSNQVSPYTVPGKPSVSASASGLTINASWSGGGGGGRAINHYSVCFQGVSCSNYASAGSAGHAYSAYSTTYSVTVTVVDSVGQSSVASSASATTGASPPPPRWLEYTGGATNTWTNYTNAGGTAGPQIAKNQGVYVSCRLTGFRVADGNTWWYRIESSPWNNTYYASADAFYNNGSTSGSLSGTPFVDTNVAMC